MEWGQLESDQALRQCQLCGYMAKSRGQLDVHLRVHTGMRPYKCETCGIAFAQKNNLTRHVTQVHSGALSFCCTVPECGFATKRREMYKLHMARHGTLEYQCRMCQSAYFMYQGDLRKHIAKAHSQLAREQQDGLATLGRLNESELQENRLNAEADPEYSEESLSAQMTPKLPRVLPPHRRQGIGLDRQLEIGDKSGRKRIKLTDTDDYQDRGGVYHAGVTSCQEEEAGYLDEEAHYNRDESYTDQEQEEQGEEDGSNVLSTKDEECIDLDEYNTEREHEEAVEGILEAIDIKQELPECSIDGFMKDPGTRTEHLMRTSVDERYRENYIEHEDNNQRLDAARQSERIGSDYKHPDNFSRKRKASLETTEIPMSSCNASSSGNQVNGYSVHREDAEILPSSLQSQASRDNTFSNRSSRQSHPAHNHGNTGRLRNNSSSYTQLPRYANESYKQIHSSSNSCILPVNNLRIKRETEARCETMPADAAWYHCETCDVYFPDRIMHAIHAGCHGYHRSLDCNTCGFSAQDRYEFTAHLARGDHCKAHNDIPQTKECL